MQAASWWINIIGILVSAIGTILVFRGTPLDSIGYNALGNTIVFREEFMKDVEAMKKRGRLSRLGLKVLLLGFVIQAIAQLLIFPS